MRAPAEKAIFATMITVGLVEDNTQLIRSVSRNFGYFGNVQLVFTARNGAEAMEKLETIQPDVLLLDINMPVKNGIETAREAGVKYPGIRIIMHTVIDAEDKIFDAIMAGATGYILKDSTPGQLIEAIEEAVDGGAPMSPSIARKAIQLIRSREKPQVRNREENEFGLSARELEILDKVAEGQAYQQIANELFVSPKTVRKHIENIYRKLQVHNKVEAVQKARNKNLLSLVLGGLMMLVNF